MAKTEIICILDRSGSMGYPESTTIEAIGGFNAFLEEQKKLPGSAKLTLCLFDHEYHILHDGVPIKKVPDIDDKTYVPRGSTALLDAIGRTVSTVKERINKTRKDRRPKSVILCILTDGLENASQEYTGDKIKEMLTECKDKDGWEIFYLAANQDAFAVGGGMGIDAPSCMNYDSHSRGGTMRAYNSMSGVVTSSRVGSSSSSTGGSGQSSSISQTNDDEEEQKQP